MRDASPDAEARNRELQLTFERFECICVCFFPPKTGLGTGFARKSRAWIFPRQFSAQLCAYMHISGVSGLIAIIYHSKRVVDVTTQASEGNNNFVRAEKTQ
jgi:hypothetical protein